MNTTITTASSSSMTPSATLVAVAENSAWYRIRMPSSLLDEETNQHYRYHYEPVITSWVVSHQKTGQKITNGSIDQVEIKQNMMISPSSITTSSDNNCNTAGQDDDRHSGGCFFEWITQVIGLQSNGSYFVNFEVLACCTKIDDLDEQAGSSSSSTEIGDTKRFILEGCSFSTLRQPVILRCVWRQCQSAVVYVTRQFPGSCEAVTSTTTTTTSIENNESSSSSCTATAVRVLEKPKEQWLANTDGSPFVPPWVAQIEVYDAESRKLVANIISSNSNNVLDERQRHMLIQELSVSHPYAIRVRAIYNKDTFINNNNHNSSSSTSSSSTKWYGPWSTFTLFRTRGPFLVRAVKTSVRYAHLMVPDLLNERYDRIPPYSILESMPPLHPSFLKAEWLPCVGSVCKPKLILSGTLANPLGMKKSRVSDSSSSSDEDEFDENGNKIEKTKKKHGAKQGACLLDSEKEHEHPSDDSDELPISRSELFTFDHDALLDDPTPILGLQPDTEYLGDAKISCDLPPFSPESIAESRVFFRTQPRIMDDGEDGSGEGGASGIMSGLYNNDGSGGGLITHATGLLGNNNRDGSSSSKAGGKKKPAVPFECTAMSVESATSLLATETSAKIGWSLQSKTFESSMQVVSAYEPRFYLVRFGYMRRGAYRLTEPDRNNIMLGPAKLAKEADWDEVIGNTHRAVKHALSSVVWKGSPQYLTTDDGSTTTNNNNNNNNDNMTSSLSLQYYQDAMVFSADRTVLLEQLEPDRRILVHVRALDMNPVYLLSVYRPGATFKDILEISPPEFLSVFAASDRPAHFPGETNITAYVTLKPPELDVKEYEVGSELAEGNLTVQLRPGIIEGERAAWRKEIAIRRGKLMYELELKREMLAAKKQRIKEERKKAKEELAKAERLKMEKEKKKMIFQNFISTTPQEPLSSENNNKKKTKKKKKRDNNKNNNDLSLSDDDDDEEEQGEEEEEDFEPELDAEFEQLLQREEEIKEEIAHLEEEPEEFAAHAWYHAQNTLSYEILFAEDLGRVVRTCQVERAKILNDDVVDPKDSEKNFILPQIGRGAFRFVPRLSQGDGSFGRRGQNLDIVVRNVEISRIDNDGKRGLRIFINKDELDPAAMSSSGDDDGDKNQHQHQHLLGPGRIPVISGAGMLTCLYLPFGDEDEAIRRKHGARIQLPVPPEAVDTGYIDLSPLLPGQYDIQVTLCVAGYIVAQEGSGALSSSKQQQQQQQQQQNEKSRELEQQPDQEDQSDDTKKQQPDSSTTSTREEQQQSNEKNDDESSDEKKATTDDASPTTTTVVTNTNTHHHPFCLPLSSSYDAPPRRGTVLRHFQLVPVMVCEHFAMLTVMATREQPPKNHLMTAEQFYMFNEQNRDKPLRHNHLLGFLEAPAKMEPEPIFSNRGVPPPSVWESDLSLADRHFDALSMSQQRRLGFLRRIHHLWMSQVKAQQTISGQHQQQTNPHSLFSGGDGGGIGGGGSSDFGDAMQQFDMQQSRFFGSQVLAPEEEETEFARTFEEKFAYIDFTRQDCFEIEFEIAKHGFYDRYGVAKSDLVDDWTKELPPHEQNDKPQRLLWSKGRTNKRPCEIIAVPLLPSTLYDFRFRIRPMDARQDFTSWSQPETFATATPWHLHCTAVTEQSATIQWTHDDGTNARKSFSSSTFENNDDRPLVSLHQQTSSAFASAPSPSSSSKKGRPIVLKWTAGRIDMMKAMLASRLEAYEEQLAHITDEDAGDLYSIALSDVVMEVEISLVINDKIRVPSTFVIPGSVANVIVRGLEPGCDYECRVRQTLPESAYASTAGNNTAISAALHDNDAGWSKPLKLHTLHNIRAQIDSYGAHHCCVLIKQAQRNTFHVPDLRFVKNAPKKVLEAVEAAKAAFASGEVSEKINQDRGMLKAYECAIHAVRFDKNSMSLMDPAHKTSRRESARSIRSHHLNNHNNNNLSTTLSDDVTSTGGGEDSITLGSDGDATLPSSTPPVSPRPRPNNRTGNNNNNNRSNNQVLKTIDDVRDLAIPPEHKAIAKKLAVWATSSSNDSMNKSSASARKRAASNASFVGNLSVTSASSHQTQNNNNASSRDQVAMANFDDLDAGICYQILGRTVLQNGEAGQWTRLAVCTTYPLPDIHIAHVTQDAAVFLWTIPDTDHHINEANAPKMTIENVEVRVEGKMLPAVYRSPIESFDETARDLHKSTRTQLFPASFHQHTNNNDTTSSKRKKIVENNSSHKHNHYHNVLRSCVFYDLVPSSVYVARVRFKDNFGKWSQYGRFPIRFKTLPMVRCSALCVGDDFAILASTHDRWYERSNAIESTSHDTIGLMTSTSAESYGGDNGGGDVFGNFEDDDGNDDDYDDDMMSEFNSSGHSGRTTSTLHQMKRRRSTMIAPDDESLPIIEAIPFLMREDEIEWSIRIVPSDNIELVASSRDVILRWAAHAEHKEVRPMSFGTYMLEGLKGHFSYAAIGRARYRDANLCPIDSLKRRAFESPTDIRVRTAVAMFTPQEIDQLRTDVQSVLTSVWSDVLSFKTTPPVKLKVVRLTHSSVIVDARRYSSVGGGGGGSITSSKKKQQQQQDAENNNNNNNEENSVAAEEQRRAAAEAAENALRTHCGALYVASKCLVQLQGRSKVHQLNLPLNSRKGAAILIVGFSADAAHGAGRCRRLDLSVQCTTTDVADALQRDASDVLLRSAFKIELPPDVVLKGKSSFIDDLGSLPRRPSIPILYECQVPTKRSRRVGASDYQVSRSILLWWGSPIQNEDMWPGVPLAVGDAEWPERLQENQLGTVSMIEDSFAVENDDRDKEIADFIDREYDMSSVLVIDLVDQQMLNKLNARRASLSANRRQSQVLVPGQSDPEIRGISKKYEVEIAQVDPLLKVRSNFVPLATIQGNRPYLRVLLDDGAPPLHHIMFRVRAKIKVQSCGLETELSTFYSAGAAWRPPVDPPPPRKLRVETRSDSSLVLYFNVDPAVYEQYNQPRFEITFPGESEHVLTVSHPPVLISRLRTVKTYTIQVATVTSFGRSSSSSNPTVKWRSPSTAIVPSSPNLFPEGTQLPVSLMVEKVEKEEREEDASIGDRMYTEEEKLARAENRRALEVLQAVAAASEQFPKATSFNPSSSSASSSMMMSMMKKSKILQGNNSNQNDDDDDSENDDHNDATASVRTRETDHFRWHWPFPQPLCVDAFPPGFGLKPTSFHFAPDFETRHERERRQQCGSDAVHVRDLPKMNYAGKSVGRVFYAQSASDDATADRFVVSANNTNNRDSDINSSNTNKRTSSSVMNKNDDRENLEDALGQTRSAIHFGQSEVDAVTKQLEQSKRDRESKRSASIRARRQSSVVAASLAAEHNNNNGDQQQRRPSSARRPTGVLAMSSLLNSNNTQINNSNNSKSSRMDKSSLLLQSTKEDKTGAQLAELSRSLWQQQEDREKQRQKDLKRQKRDERDRLKLEQLSKKNQFQQQSNAFLSNLVSQTHTTSNDEGDDEIFNDEQEQQDMTDDPFSNITQLDTTTNMTNRRSSNPRLSIEESLRRYSETKEERRRHSSATVTDNNSNNGSRSASTSRNGSLLPSPRKSSQHQHHQQQNDLGSGDTTVPFIPRRPSAVRPPPAFHQQQSSSSMTSSGRRKSYS